MLEDLGLDAGETPPRGPDKPRRKRRWGRRILAVLLGVVLLVGLGVGGYLGFLNHTVSKNVQHQDLLGEGNGNNGTPDPNASKVVAGRGTNYLFIGSDARPGDTFSRSDVIILMHISQDSNKVYLIHFPRDLYVAIPGHGKNKINASYAFGGAPLLVQTLQDLIGVKIDHVAKTDFTGFAAMTDAVGGVRVWAAEASNGSGNGGPVVITKGWNNLNGTQALAFVRERYLLSQGDISRGQRQLAFIKALMTKAVSKSVVTNPIKVAQFLDAATKNLVVDKSLSVGDMRAQAFALRNIRSTDIVFVTAPFTGFASVPGAGDVDLVDDTGMATLGQNVANDTMDQYRDVTVIP
ncbi:MAG: LCP family protein [Nostocoides sp.]